MKNKSLGSRETKESDTMFFMEKAFKNHLELVFLSKQVMHDKNKSLFLTWHDTGQLFMLKRMFASFVTNRSDRIFLSQDVLSRMQYLNDFISISISISIDSLLLFLPLEPSFPLKIEKMMRWEPRKNERMNKNSCFFCLTHEKTVQVSTPSSKSTAQLKW